MGQMIGKDRIVLASTPLGKNVFYDFFTKAKQAHGGKRFDKCIGPIPEGNKCRMKLDPETNFGNCYCWNCILSYLRGKGETEAANDIIENYL